MLLTLMMLAVFSQCDRAGSYCTFTAPLHQRQMEYITIQHYVVEDSCVRDYFETL